MIIIIRLLNVTTTRFIKKKKKNHLIQDHAFKQDHVQATRISLALSLQRTLKQLYDVDMSPAELFDHHQSILLCTSRINGHEISADQITCAMRKDVHPRCSNCPTRMHLTSHKIFFFLLRSDP